jgi:hypothetical protein
MERTVFAVLVIIRALGCQTFYVPIRRVWGSLPIRPHLSVSVSVFSHRQICFSFFSLSPTRNKSFVLFYLLSLSTDICDYTLARLPVLIPDYLVIARESSANVTSERWNKTVEDSRPNSQKKREGEMSFLWTCLNLLLHEGKEREPTVTFSDECHRTFLLIEKLNRFRFFSCDTGWSEPAATSAPVQDEAVQVILGMNPNTSK